MASGALLAASHCGPPSSDELFGAPAHPNGGAAGLVSSAGSGAGTIVIPHAGAGGQRSSGSAGRASAGRGGSVAESMGGAGGSDARGGENELGGGGADAGAAGERANAGAGGDGPLGSPTCAEDAARCSEACVDLSSDPAHCGACANACAPEQACEDGACLCPGAQELCDGACVELGVNVEHCGECGVRCGESEICRDGVCACPEGQVVCDGSCVDTQSNPSFCGGCDSHCEAGWLCSQAQCLRSPCDGLCADAEHVAEEEDGFRMEGFKRRAGCFEVVGYAPTETPPRIVCWGFAQNRRLRVNGLDTRCVSDDGHPLPEPRAGGYCIEVGRGPEDFAGILLPTR